MKKNVVLFCLIALGINVNAQSSNSGNNSKSGSNSNNKLFYAIGFSPGTGFTQSPTTHYFNYQEAYSSNGNFIGMEAGPTLNANLFEWDLISFVFRFRYNISEMGNNQALSVSAIPVIGGGFTQGGGFGADANYGGSGIMSITLPVFFEYNIGNVSTYNTDKDNGFVIGIGPEFVCAPVIIFSEGTYTNANDESATITNPPPNTWLGGVVELGYRHWNKKNKAKEINFQFGMGATGAFTFRLSWLKYINY